MKDKLNNKVAVSASRPLNCSTAVDQHEPKIECASCGVLTTADRADFAEGDGGMIPDRWFCHRCEALEKLRETESLFCEICGESFCDCDDDYDDDDWDRTDPNLCESCGGDLDVFQVCNDCDV